MTEKTDRPRTSDEDRNAADVKADDPKRSMERLEDLAKKVLKVPKDVVDRLREGNGTA